MGNKRTSYTGGQYRGGRTAGRKNLVRVDGGYQNQHGVTFTEQEKKALETAVNTANRKRARLYKQEGELDLIINGKPTGEKVQSLHLMGKESDFILAPKSKSLQQFKTKADYENYIANVRNVNRREYVDERTEQYRDNYFTGLDRAFGDEAKDIKDKLSGMSPKEYRDFVASHDDVLEIGYMYLPSARTEKLNEIRTALDMDTVEVPDDDEVLDLKRRTTRGKRK